MAYYIFICYIGDMKTKFIASCLVFEARWYNLFIYSDRQKIEEENICFYELWYLGKVYIFRKLLICWEKSHVSIIWMFTSLCFNQNVCPCSKVKPSCKCLISLVGLEAYPRCSRCTCTPPIPHIYHQSIGSWLSRGNAAPRNAKSLSIQYSVNIFQNPLFDFDIPFS